MGKKRYYFNCPYYFKDKDGFYYRVICINDNTNTITGKAESGVEIDFNLSDVTLFDENEREITEEKI